MLYRATINWPCSANSQLDWIESQTLLEVWLNLHVKNRWRWQGQSIEFDRDQDLTLFLLEWT